MRLGISPAAAPTLTGVFNQRFEALFPSAGALACTVCFDPRHSSGLSVRECGASVCYPCCACPALCHSESSPLGLSARMWGRRVCECSDCLPRSSHTLPVSDPPQPRKSSPPWCPSPPLLLLDACFFFIYLVSDFLAIRFSVSSGCARRCSVSSYATILVLGLY